MMVVLLVGAHALVAHHRLTGLNALHEPQALQLVEDAIHARAAHPPFGLTQDTLDLNGRQRTGLGIEQLQHRPPCAATLVTGRGQRRLRALDPAAIWGGGYRGLRARAHSAMVDASMSVLT
jgi:hypothetical protein